MFKTFSSFRLIYKFIRFDEGLKTETFNLGKIKSSSEVVFFIYVYFHTVRFIFSFPIYIYIYIYMYVCIYLCIYMYIIQARFVKDDGTLFVYYF